MDGFARIREVWAENLESEFRVLRELIDTYPCVSMDTEFPGVVARPVGQFKTSSDYHYQTMRCNVDLLKIIQLGLTLSDEQGNFPPDVCTWQFNFTFDLGGDMYANESIELLKSCGIDFKRHEDYGIDMEIFGELLVSSGLVLLDDVKWISFHSGYDFGYLLKVLTAAPLPPTEAEFFDLLQIWFPIIYDIKYIIRLTPELRGGLENIAEELSVIRIGPSHQAGSDALLTAGVYFKVRQKFQEGGKWTEEKWRGLLYGLGKGAFQPPSSGQAGLPAGSKPVAAVLPNMGLDTAPAPTEAIAPLARIATTTPLSYSHSSNSITMSQPSFNEKSVNSNFRKIIPQPPRR